MNIKNVLFFLERVDAVSTRWDNVDESVGIQLVASNLDKAEAQGESRESDDEEKPTASPEQTEAEKAAAATGYVEDERGPSDIEEENRVLDNKFKAAKGKSVGSRGMEGTFDLDRESPFVPKGSEPLEDLASLLAMLPTDDPRRAAAIPGGATISLAVTAPALPTDRKAVRKRTIPALDELMKLSPEHREAGRFVVFCPRGHRMVVSSQIIGQIGRCKRCQGQVLIPSPPDASLEILMQAEPETKPAEVAAPAPNAEQMFRKWLTDARFHRVQPNKLKLTPGSLLADAPTADVGFSNEQLLIAVVFAGSGAFRTFREPKQKPVTRTALQNHLKMGKPLAELPVPEHHLLNRADFGEFRVVQPTPPGDESLFLDVPVFGEGRIGIRVPTPEGSPDRWYLSFNLSQFRDFSVALQEFYNIEQFGTGTGVPLLDEFADHSCHYTTDTLRALKRVEYYQADPSFELNNIGWKCGHCGIVVGEAARRKEKIGGKSPSSVPKARCPKCKQYFGNHPLWGLRG